MFCYYTTLAKHFETCKIAVTASAQDITEQMDSWTSLPSRPNSQASVGVGKKKNLHFQYHWSEAWEIFSFEPLNSRSSVIFRFPSMHLEFVSELKE